MHFLELSTEIRSRIYEYAFGDTTVRYTRPITGGRARVYAKAKQNLGLLTSCKLIYLEAHPLYISLIRLVLNNTHEYDIPKYIQTTILPQIRYLEIDCAFPSDKTGFDISIFPALEELKVKRVKPSGYGLLQLTDPHRQPPTPEELDAYLNGSKDSDILAPGSRGLDLTHYLDVRHGPHRGIYHSVWLTRLAKDTSRKFRILDTCRRREPHRDGAITLELLYDVDTLLPVERTVCDERSKRMTVWSEGKIRTYTLQKKSGKPGKLLSTEDWIRSV